MNILLVIDLPEAQRLPFQEGIARAFPSYAVNLVNHHSKVDPYIADADVICALSQHLTEHVIEKAKNLKWIQAIGTGVDGIIDSKALPKDAVVTNIHGVHGETMSEAALMVMLALARNLPRNIRNQAKHEWNPWPSRLISGKTVGILGVGVIAEVFAPYCKAMGMTVVGFSSAQRSLPGFDRMESKDRLTETIGDVDYLVLLTPYSKETHHLVNASVMKAMKRGSFLINLARGGVLDEMALIDALKSGHLAGAALDVFATEPLPKDSPLWDVENIIITTHQGAFHNETPQKVLPTIIENIRRFAAGDTASMINRVKRA